VLAEEKLGHIVLLEIWGLEAVGEVLEEAVAANLQATSKSFVRRLTA
jgi:hypothetical protein